MHGEFIKIVEDSTRKKIEESIIGDAFNKIKKHVKDVKYLEIAKKTLKTLKNLIPKSMEKEDYSRMVAISTTLSALNSKIQSERPGRTGARGENFNLKEAGTLGIDKETLEFYLQNLNQFLKESKNWGVKLTKINDNLFEIR